MKIGKYVPITATAITATSSLFVLMTSLVASDTVILEEKAPTQFLDYVQVDTPTTPEPIDRSVPKPIEVVTPPDQEEFPPATPDETSVPPTIKPQPPHLPEPEIDLNGYTDGEQIPLVRTQPNYPRRAANNGIEGWAVVAFRIDTTGQVQEPYIVEAEPKGYFERETLKAISKFRYKPKVTNGTPVESYGQFRMVFDLQE